jgi:hypothetical protein
VNAACVAHVRYHHEGRCDHPSSRGSGANQISHVLTRVRVIGCVSFWIDLRRAPVTMWHRWAVWDRMSVLFCHCRHSCKGSSNAAGACAALSDSRSWEFDKDAPTDVDVIRTTTTTTKMMTMTMMMMTMTTTMTMTTMTMMMTTTVKTTMSITIDAPAADERPQVLFAVLVAKAALKVYLDPMKWTMSRRLLQQRLETSEQHAVALEWPASSSEV